MATVSAFIRKTSTSLAKIRFRLRDGRNLQLFYVSNILIEPELWDNKKQEVKSRVLVSKEKRLTINNKVSELKRIILDIYLCNPNIKTSEMFSELIDRRINPDKYDESEDLRLNTLFAQFIEQRQSHVSTLRVRKYESVYRILQRYQLYRRYELRADLTTLDTIIDIEQYLKQEHLIYNRCPELFSLVPDSRFKSQRGKNTVADRMKVIRTFYKWCETSGIISNNPFAQYKVEAQVYGTPYYISIEERNRIYKMSLHNHPELARQRDIFVFHCLIGCRISDLYSLTRNNIVDNCIQYVPHKTKDSIPKTVKVPLNDIAKEILDKYKNFSNNKILPLISMVNYNKAIKKIFLAARINRPVIVIDSITREPVVKPLYEIASSHIARRTFIGNLYKKVQDPSLISSLSGHEEGSRAFLRYRNIDDEIKAQLVKLLEK